MQRYWIKTKRYKNLVVSAGRYEFHGTGRDLGKAVRLAMKVMPNGYVDVSARKFADNPEKYGTKGFWMEARVVSG
jgi:hypothetical protein